jgi:hypothetical protein
MGGLFHAAQVSRKPWWISMLAFLVNLLQKLCGVPLRFRVFIIACIGHVLTSLFQKSDQDALLAIINLAVKDHSHVPISVP